MKSRPMFRGGSSVLRSGVSIAVALVFLLPLWWVVVTSLRWTGEAPSLSIEWWPIRPAWGNYREVFNLAPLAREAWNSLIVGLAAVPLTILTASWAGYAMMNLTGRWQRRFLAGAVILMLVPVTALWITRFFLFKSLGLMNTLWALILPAVGGTNPFYVLLFFWTFQRIPREVFDAARLDGAGHWWIWGHIAMPIARPTIVTVSVLTFSYYWSDLLSPLLYLRSESLYTLPLGLQALQQLDFTYGPLIMAGAVIMLLPIVLIFLAAHRFFWPDEMLLHVTVESQSDSTVGDGEGGEIAARQS